MSDASRPAGGSNLPAQREMHLDRPALERVLTRAAELQASTTDSTELLTEAQLLEIGREVGLSPTNLRQALAEERARLADQEAGDALSRMFGPAQVSARRTLHGDQTHLLESLDEWMQREESLQVKRRFRDRILWEPRKGFMSEMTRSFDFRGRGYHLCKAEEIGATIVPLDEGRVLVHLTADVRPARSNRLFAGGAIGTSGATVTGILLILGVFPPVAVAAALAGAGAGYAVARTHQPMVGRVQLALEQVLDRLERGELPRRGLLGELRNSNRLLGP